MKTIACVTCVATLCLVATQAMAQASAPWTSQAAPSEVSQAAIMEMPLDGTGAPMAWAGVARYGHGPVQLVLEVARAHKWIGQSCLKFITMEQEHSSYRASYAGYLFTYSTATPSNSTSYADRPDANRFAQFENVLVIDKEDSVWQATLRTLGNQRQMRWVNENGKMENKRDSMTAMKALQLTPHCAF